MKRKVKMLYLTKETLRHIIGGIVTHPVRPSNDGTCMSCEIPCVTK